ncbi:MAG: glycosyltransferase family 2 protein [Planctomycetes bacterium]|nr:glycosyltransferase family 2 protein [Planctomycetota bacterium]
MIADRISVVVIAKDEEDNIAGCLQSLSQYEDIVVVDDYSTDRTADLAETFGARVVQHRFESFAKQRNWALEHIEFENEWILFLDADEHASPEFSSALLDEVESAPDDCAVCRVCRKTMFMGKWLRYSDGFPVWIMRVVRQGRAKFQDSGHGEVPVPVVEGSLGTIHEPIVHYPFSKGLDDWIERHNRYSTREAGLEVTELPGLRYRELLSLDAAKRRRAIRNLGRRLPCRPLLRFAYQYFWRRGFLDGQAGLTFSTLMATYEAMIVAKRRELVSRSKAQAAAARATVFENQPIGLNETASGDRESEVGVPPGFDEECEPLEQSQDRAILPK